MRTTDRVHIGRRSAIGFGVAALLTAWAIVAAPALAADEERQGAQLLRGVEAGTVTCRSIDDRGFERIGEYAMGRMLGSASAHQAMNRQLVATMGSRGEARAHVFMGQRFAGCASGRAPTAFGAMMGMMGAGMMGSAYGGGPGMMGGAPRGWMPGFDSGSPAGRDGGWTGADTVMVALMGLLVALAVGALAVLRPRPGRSGGTALETLRRRYAHGEIDQQEFDRRRQALGGQA